jgi:hypothetical protein
MDAAGRRLDAHSLTGARLKRWFPVPVVVVVVVGGLAMLPWGGPPGAAFHSVERVTVQQDGRARPLAAGDGRMLVDQIASCTPVGMPQRLRSCAAASGTAVTWAASGYPVTATVGADRVWMTWQGSFGPCAGRYVMDCTVTIPDPPKMELPPVRSDVVTLRAHAKMLSILLGREADSAWLDDLDALKGDTRYLVSATGDEVGWRVEGSGPEFIAAMRAIAGRRLPDLVGRASGWSADGLSAVEVVLGTPGWTRIETTGTLATARARMSDRVPKAPLDRVLGAHPSGADLWVGLWASGGKTGFVVADRDHPGSADVIVDGQTTSAPDHKDRRVETTRGLPGGDALGCIDTLTAAGATGHGARLGKVFAELGADSCESIRERGFGTDRAWIVEIRPR